MYVLLVQKAISEMTMGVSLGLREDETVPEGGVSLEAVSEAGEAFDRMRADAMHRIRLVRYIFEIVGFSRSLFWFDCGSFVYLAGWMSVWISGWY